MSRISGSQTLKIQTNLLIKRIQEQKVDSDIENEIIMLIKNDEEKGCYFLTEHHFNFWMDLAFKKNKKSSDSAKPKSGKELAKIFLDKNDPRISDNGISNDSVSKFIRCVEESSIEEIKRSTFLKILNGIDGFPSLTQEEVEYRFRSYPDFPKDEYKKKDKKTGKKKDKKVLTSYKLHTINRYWLKFLGIDLYEINLDDYYYDDDPDLKIDIQGLSDKQKMHFMKYAELYTTINENSWDFLVSYTQLNSGNKKVLKELLFNSSVSVGNMVQNLSSKILKYLEIGLDIAVEQRTSKDKTRIMKSLKSKFDLLLPAEQDTFYLWFEEFKTMDETDWKILAAYEIFGDQDEKLLTFADQLLSEQLVGKP